jgi:hypothetical protein
MQPASGNSDDSQMEPDPLFDPKVFAFTPIEDAESELDEEIDRAIGVVMGLRAAVLHPGAAINRAALAAADDWLRQFQSPME